MRQLSLIIFAHITTVIFEQKAQKKINNSTSIDDKNDVESTSFNIGY